jgi:hypothetical protein
VPAPLYPAARQSDAHSSLWLCTAHASLARELDLPAAAARSPCPTRPPPTGFASLIHPQSCMSWFQRRVANSARSGPPCRYANLQARRTCGREGAPWRSGVRSAPWSSQGISECYGCVSDQVRARVPHRRGEAAISSGSQQPRDGRCQRAVLGRVLISPRWQSMSDGGLAVSGLCRGMARLLSSHQASGVALMPWKVCTICWLSCAAWCSARRHAVLPPLCVWSVCWCNDVHAE